MSNILVINAAGAEPRVALIENGSISEYYLDRKRDRGIVGNIYKGRVVRVLPGMQAAFVDIGLEKAAFLYVSDVFYDPDFSDQEFDLTEGEHGEHEEPPAEEQVEEAEAEAVKAAQEISASPPPQDSAPGDEPVLALGSDPRAPEVSSEVPEVQTATPPLETAESLGDEGQEDGPGSGENGDDSLEDDDEEDDNDAAEVSVSSAEPPTEPSVSLSTEPQAPQQGSLSSPRPAQAAKEGSGRRRRRRRRGRGAGDKGGRPQPRSEDRSAAAPEAKAEAANQNRNGSGKGRNAGPAQIQDLLKEGQEVIVQVVKDPIGTKGARITSHISLPGRHLVFMPTVDHVGISRRIDNEKERRRLRDLVNRMRPPGTGFIVRTVAENVSEEKLAADIRFLIQVWNEVGKEKDRKGAPVLLHPDLDMVLRATRDLFTQDVSKLVIDDREEYERVLSFVEAQEPAL
jgi:ribonuclease G